MRHFFYAIAVLLTVAGCGDSASSNRQSESNQQLEESQTATIPEDVTYEVINEKIMPGTKRSLDIRLNRRVSEKVLRSLAVKLKSSDSGSYERTFILYYLPDMTVDAGAWAKTHFNPDLEVGILGSTAEEAKALRQSSDNSSREVIGRWLDDGGFSDNRLILFRKDGDLRVEQTYGDGSSRVMEVVEKQSSRGRRIERKNDDTVDYWLIDESGNLQIRDDEGLIRTAGKLE